MRKLNVIKFKGKKIFCYLKYANFAAMPSSRFRSVVGYCWSAVVANWIRIRTNVHEFDCQPLVEGKSFWEKFSPSASPLTNPGTELDLELVFLLGFGPSARKRLPYYFRLEGYSGIFFQQMRGAVRFLVCLWLPLTFKLILSFEVSLLWLTGR